jgi:glycosyltransferase involved in cell wall biosynthesis
MSHIAIDARELRTSSGRYVERLLHYLQKIDNVNTYSVLLKPEDIQGWKALNPNFSAVACPYKEFTFSEQLGLRKQLKNLGPDLVHFTFPQQPIWYRGKTITTIHDLTTLRFDNPDKNRLIFKIKQRVFAHVIKKSAHKATSIITPSNFVKNDIVHFSSIDSKKVTVTYEAADAINETAKPIASLEGQEFIMYVGRPTPHKNLERLVEAFSIVRVEHPGLKLVLAGKEDANYRRLANKIKGTISDSVIFTGFVEDSKLLWLYENCEAYVFPSLSEGFGLPGLEAMLNGAPVVSSSFTCLPEIYGEAAKYFNPTDVESMATSISEVLDNKKMRAKLIKSGKMHAEKYSWKCMAEQTLEIYNKALKE